MLAIIIKRAIFFAKIERVVSYLVDGGLSILQYADAIILIMEHDLENARNIKLIFTSFQETFRTQNKFSQKVNYFVSARHERGCPPRQIVWLWARPVSYQLFRHPDSISEIHKR
jgi:hypothetical protein